MIQRIKSSYFAHSNYTLIYIHYFFHSIATTAMYIFTGAYFLKLGMALPLVVLFYGLEFGLRGALVPWGMALLSRIGLAPGAFASAGFSIIFFIGLAYADHSLAIGFFSLVFASISGAIYYPVMDVLEALYIEEDHNRGKQMSVTMILVSLAGIFGAAGTGFLIAHYGFESVVIMVFITKIIAMLPFLKFGKLMPLPDIQSKNVMRLFMSEEFRPLWKPFFGEQLVIILRWVMVPIFIYTIVGEVDMLGYLIAAALVIEKIFTLCAGHAIDRHGQARIMRITFFAYAPVMAAYIMLVKTPLSAFMAESAQKIVGNMSDGSFRSAIHIHARKNYEGRIILFGAVWQMALCFGELIVLPLYALLACFVGINVFYISCVAALAGMYLMLSFFKNQQR